MKTKMHEMILDDARDVVAKRHGYGDWAQIDMLDLTQSEMDEIKSNLSSEVAILCMEKVLTFYLHILAIGYSIIDEDFDGEPIFEKKGASPQMTESELYDGYVEWLNNPQS